MNEIVLKRRLLFGLLQSIYESSKVFVIIFAAYKYLSVSVDWHIIQIVCIIAWTYEMSVLLATLFWLKDDLES